MSHFTNMKTSFKNVSHLEKTLSKLNINYKPLILERSRHNSKHSLIISQSNGYDIMFKWNGQEYELIVDISFWEQSYPIESFIDKIAQQYASEVIITESQKLGFQPVKYRQNQDGSNTVVLERWNERSIA